MLEQMLKNMGVDLPAMQTTARDFVARFEAVEKQVKEIHAAIARIECRYPVNPHTLDETEENK